MYDRRTHRSLSHPAFQGGFVTSPTSGIAHDVLFGTLARLAGADATIFPNDGGRFTFSRAECDAIAAATAAPMGRLAPIFPVPAGGVSLERVPELRESAALPGHVVRRTQVAGSGSTSPSER